MVKELAQPMLTRGMNQQPKNGCLHPEILEEQLLVQWVVRLDIVRAYTLESAREETALLPGL
jgi:hypothetical protein